MRYKIFGISIEQMVRYPRRVTRPQRARKIKRYGRLRRSRGRISRRIPGGPVQPVQYFKRTTYQTQFLQTAISSDQFKQLEFSLNDVPNYTEFTSLYDQYCIKGVRLTLMPRFNSGEPLVANGLNVPQTWSCLDYDGNGPTSLSAILQYQNLRMVSGFKFHKRYLVPAIAASLYESATATAYQPKKGQFIDCNMADVPHYGVTLCVPQSGVPDGIYSWDLKVDYYLAFKNVR